MFEETGPKSDRELDAEWRRTLYAELKAQRKVLDRISYGVLAIAAMAAMAFAKLMW